MMVENSTIIIKSWPTNTLQCLLWSNAHADVLDYRELRWKSLLSPVDLTLAFIKNEIRQVRGSCKTLLTVFRWGRVSVADDALGNSINTVTITPGKSPVCG